MAVFIVLVVVICIVVFVVKKNAQKKEELINGVVYKDWVIPLRNALEKAGYKVDSVDSMSIKSDFGLYRGIMRVYKADKHLGDIHFAADSRALSDVRSHLYKSKEQFCHQLELSENSNEYSFSLQGNITDVNVIKKEKFFDDYSMYTSYRAYASIYSYYYIINEEDKDIFHKRIAPDEANENFSSEANILFVLETELFKVSAGLALSKKINEQINNPNMREIQEMFKRFINTRPLFEKLSYCYLGAQKEADFIYKQFRIGDILADYDRKRELLKSYSEVTNSIIASNNSKILNCIGILFTFIAGFDRLSNISHIIFDNEKTIKWNIDFIIPTIVSLIIIGIIIRFIDPVKYLRTLLKNLFGRIS
jgi:hypothetical protein